jgi:hypothetical protein
VNSPTANRFLVGRFQAAEGTRNRSGHGGTRRRKQDVPKPPPSGRRARLHRETVVLGGEAVA